MKNEDLCFKAWTISHNEQGEKVKIDFGKFAKSEIVVLLEIIGIKTPYTALYSWKKAKVFPIEPQFMDTLEKAKFMRFGEFKYEPHIYIERA